MAQRVGERWLKIRDGRARWLRDGKERSGRDDSNLGWESGREMAQRVGERSGREMTQTLGWRVGERWPSGREMAQRVCEMAREWERWLKVRDGREMSQSIWRQRFERDVINMQEKERDI